MQILQTFILILFFVCCVVLIFLIMIQSGKGGSLGILGGGGSSSAFGSSTMDVVTKATWWGAIAFFTLAIMAAIVFADTGTSLPVSPDDTSIEEESIPADSEGNSTATGEP